MRNYSFFNSLILSFLNPLLPIFVLRRIQRMHFNLPLQMRLLLLKPHHYYQHPAPSEHSCVTINSLIPSLFNSFIPSYRYFILRRIQRIHFNLPLQMRLLLSELHYYYQHPAPPEHSCVTIHSLITSLLTAKPMPFQ